jgi:hypothetical protein
MAPEEPWSPRAARQMQQPHAYVPSARGMAGAGRRLHWQASTPPPASSRGRSRDRLRRSERVPTTSSARRVRSVARQGRAERDRVHRPRIRLVDGICLFGRERTAPTAPAAGPWQAGWFGSPSSFDLARTYRMRPDAWHYAGECMIAPFLNSRIGALHRHGAMEDLPSPIHGCFS